MAEKRFDVGMIGLGTMGRNLVLNFLDGGRKAAGYDRDPAKADALQREAAGRAVLGTTRLSSFIDSLTRPRVVMLLVPAGKIVDQVLEELLPLLASGDVVIDGGNSHFTDTDRRAARFAARDLGFLGVGVSGGAEGARHGPSLMPGGPPAAYRIVEELLRDAAAKVDGDPCVAHLGPGSAGHYVKMVHNGIEYGLMQLIAEVYDLLHGGLGLDNDRLADVFAAWNESDLGGFLIEITARIFRHDDSRTGRRLIDLIADAAGQKGTGMWTSQEALQQQVPTPTIDAAVAMRDLSGDGPARGAIQDRYGEARGRLDGAPPDVIAACEQALRAASALTYAQGFALIQKGSAAHGYGVDLATVARIWRGGCIIRAKLLQDIRAAYTSQPDLPHLVADPALARIVTAGEAALRDVVRRAVATGVPVPALSASLAYLDAYRSRRLPANLIQAQRDLFGAHTYRRIDDDEIHHTEWDRT